MTSILQSLPKTIHFSALLALILFLGLHFFGDGFAFDLSFWSWLTRYVHVIVAIMWIGLLWYFNFVQIPNMSKIPDDQNIMICIAMGYPDESFAANDVRSVRANNKDFVKYLGFDNE